MQFFLAVMISVTLIHLVQVCQKGSRICQVQYDDIVVSKSIRLKVSKSSHKQILKSSLEPKNERFFFVFMS